jgi:hypothetical protein
LQIVLNSVVRDRIALSFIRLGKEVEGKTSTFAAVWNGMRLSEPDNERGQLDWKLLGI